MLTSERIADGFIRQVALSQEEALHASLWPYTDKLDPVAYPSATRWVTCLRCHSEAVN